MSDALPLPDRPSIEFYRKVAKEFQRAARSTQPGAIRDWAAALRERTGTTDVHLARRLERHWNRLVAKKPTLAACALTDAQFFVARAHGFASWPVFAKHVEGLWRERSGTALFESAVDAVVSGDIAKLQRLLDEHPELVRARSTREHRATLLHYVSANGVEDFRQKTPKNIVEIARLLLDAGADVNAESNSYGPGDTTLLLTATSVHPEAAGVQIPLLELLLDRGAAIDVPGAGRTVNACLHNGRGPAADFLASRGARLDLEGAAGVGRLDVVRTFFGPNGTLTNGATTKQILDGFARACQFGKANVVEFLANHGGDVESALPHNGQSGLHWAAYGGHADIVRFLVARGAPVNRKDRTYHGTPLEWALYAWGNRDMTEREREGYYEVVRTLVRSGGTLSLAWFTEDDRERQRSVRRLQTDARMRAALAERPV